MAVDNCLEIDIPDSVLAACTTIERGHSMELYTTCVKKDQTQDETVNKEEPFTIFAVKKDTSVVFSLYSASTGTVFREKISGIWSCQVHSTCTHISSTRPQHEGILDTKNVAMDYIDASEGQSCYSSTDIVKHEIETLEKELPVEHPDSSSTNSLQFSEDFAMTQSTVSITDLNPIKEEPDDLEAGVSTFDQIDNQPPTISTDFSGTCGSSGTSSDEDIGTPEINNVNMKSTDYLDADSEDNFDKKDEHKLDDGRDCEQDEAKRMKPYACGRCDERFETKYRLSLHHRVHDSDKPLQCPLCDKQFKLKIHLEPHIQKHKMLTCIACDRTFKAKYSFERHMRVHRGEKPYSCDTCGKRFVDSRSCELHRAMHSAERPFMCAICGKTYRQQGSLTVHMQSHGDKPYKCLACDKAFADNSERKEHEKSHHDDNSFVCATCGKTFWQKRILLGHIKTHSDSKAHKCHICGKAFRRNTHLQVHIRQHTGEKPYSCRLCDKSFRQNVLLRRHMQMDH